MLGKVFVVSFALVGAPGESKAFYFTTPFDLQLIHVSACNITGGTATLTMSDDATDITDTVTIGTNITPVVLDLDEMASDAYPHIAGGSVVGFALADTDSDDVMIVATFLVG